MKNHKQELLVRMQRQYHRKHPWRLNHNGLYVPHSYNETRPDSLSRWDDVGFILNGRRIIVWWQHPRHVYGSAIDEQSWVEAGPGPQDDWLLDGTTTNYKRVGKSRKKIVSYTTRQPSAEQEAHYKQLRLIRERLTAEGIDLEVNASWKRERLNWATGISLIVPLEVRNEVELAQVASLARRLLVGQTTLEKEFPGYRYGKNEWIKEQKAAAK
ncbi:hypothetical protein [Noviherbaspirillum sedimenti]|uniref:Uncharacterized protein n=1 Tax=Noviherbaspirillum sedimenti TaxID=2320865 RepID=A0A3A3G2B7_9BURK|nr:hypothetical protein [Noviherbaspirillum sedimenti]RJG02638.1 hypothetical protein D3878_14515 [Noviherbaspirillum sedimenti]